jgi:hypothetical protein
MNIENTAQFRKKILFVPYFYPSEFADWQFTIALNPRGGWAILLKIRQMLSAGRTFYI